MTTHVFIVDETTFKCHLNYLFAGTGAKDKDVDFNNCGSSIFYPNKKHAVEAGLVAMMADVCRIRNNDYIIFYLQATSKQEGRFYGIFQVVGDAFLDRNDEFQFIKSSLHKNLTFRIKIRPYEVYSKGVTEWKALDEIRNISCPSQMLWSLIYRKLKGNRGNTMITIYEAEKLNELIRRENGRVPLANTGSYDYLAGSIICSRTNYNYTGRQESFNIMPRLIEKYQNRLAHEAHLQMYISQKLGRDDKLDSALGINGMSIEWIGNEVSCGVGMQKIDVMISAIMNETQRIIMPIELKCVHASDDNLRQINRYIDWIEQYYIPNRMSAIQPVLICRSGGLNATLRQKFKNFNDIAQGKYLPLKYIEYSLQGLNLVFTHIKY